METNNFVNDGSVFFGNGCTQIDSFLLYARALAFYRNIFGAQTKSTHVYLPEYIYADLMRNSFCGNKFAGAFFFNYEGDTHLSNYNGAEEIEIIGVETHCRANATKPLALKLKTTNLQINDRLQVLDSVNDVNVRYKDTAAPAQFRVTGLNKDIVYIDCLGDLSRALNSLEKADKLSVLPSFQSGGICLEDGSNKMLLVYPL